MFVTHPDSDFSVDVIERGLSGGVASSLALFVGHGQARDDPEIVRQDRPGNIQLAMNEALAPT